MRNDQDSFSYFIVMFFVRLLQEFIYHIFTFTPIMLFLAFIFFCIGTIFAGTPTLIVLSKVFSYLIYFRDTTNDPNMELGPEFFSMILLYSFLISKLIKKLFKPYNIKISKVKIFIYSGLAVLPLASMTAYVMEEYFFVPLFYIIAMGGLGFYMYINATISRAKFKPVTTVATPQI